MAAGSRRAQLVQPEHTTYLRRAITVLLARTAAAVKVLARHAPPARISPTAGSRAAVFVLLVLTVVALVRLNARNVLPGRSKDQPDSRRAHCVLLARTAAAVKALARHAPPARISPTAGS